MATKRRLIPGPLKAPTTLEEAQQQEREKFYGLSEQEKVAAGGYNRPTGFITKSTDPRFMNRLGEQYGVNQTQWTPYSPQGQGGVSAGGAAQFYGVEPSQFDVWETNYANQLMERVRSEFGQMGTLSSSAFATGAIGAATQAKQARVGMEQSEKARRTQWELERWQQQERQREFGQSEQVRWARLQMAQQEAQFQRLKWGQTLARLDMRTLYEVNQVVNDAYGRTQAPMPQEEQGWIPGQEYRGPASSVSRIGGTDNQQNQTPVYGGSTQYRQANRGQF